ncbi:FKBP-type peptidyl-prolyl cis-trans isomerase [Limnoglobus roseus]|uniref:Peptidyl-prolyl cis-trans isomerase n=1 Tax=Limnoglobus roseus TaxID=2598579 RepID=A0A5C1A7I0_9BACT|nr:FKBP-type peptidyl-prolyl cis-trans isomerase [Limnoglobus roseus]QEL15249.1 peptidylprolyl isomerase [Limnoglobus roseus]
MSDRPGKEQMMKMFVPAIAIAVVILLVGVLVAYRNNEDTSGPSNAKPIPGTAAKPGVQIPADIEGLTLDKPPENAPEWKDIGDGLKVWDVKEGTGDECVPGAHAVMHYTGWTLDGKIFDSSVKRGAVPDLPALGSLIEGWQKGVPGMKPGGIRRLYIPWKMAYGERGSGASIPPRADLIFEIKYFGTK